MAVCLVGRAETDDGLDLDERWLVGARLGLGNRLPDGSDVGVAVLDRQHLPAVGLVALAHVLREGELGVAVDGDAIVVVEDNELAEAKMTCVGAGLMGDAFL